MSDTVTHPRPPRRPSLGLLGFGAFGQLAAAMLREHLAIRVHDPSAAAQDRARAAGFQVVDLASAAACEVVLLAVPVSALESTLRAVATHLRPRALVVDLASIKEEPARLMDELLPRHVRLVATHPMFGPRSAADRAGALTVVVCPVRDGSWRPVARFLGRRGLRVVIATPEEHDRQAALTQGLTHLLAGPLSSLDHSGLIRTRSFDLLMAALAMVKDDASELREAITRRNRHVATVREELIRGLADGCPTSLSRRRGAAP